jgi:hypothetical protein
MTMANSQHIKTYKSLGVELLSSDGREYVARCPFLDCGHDKLYINIEEGFFDCKVCGRSGNKYTFMSYLYDEFFGETKEEHYQSLASNRGLEPDAFIAAELAYDQRFREWWIPIRNDKGSLTNLRIFNPESGILRNCGGCTVALYGLERLRKNCKKVAICEGEWDAIALEHLLLQENTTDIDILAVPGASVFKEAWTKYFTDKEVLLLYDNDKAGREGSARTLKILNSTGTNTTRPKTIKSLQWSTSYPDKFDVRDYVTNTVGESDRWLGLLSLLHSETSHSNADTPKVVRRSFLEVVRDFRTHIQHIPEDCIKGLLLELAVVFSNKIPGEPIWLFIVGPPGSGKTMMLQSVSDVPITHYESNLNPKTLVSGFKMTDGTDPSLLPKIIGKTLILKEYTEIMSLSGADQEFLFGVLRGAYDGRVERTYAHGVTRVYPDPTSEHKTCHFSLLAGVTNAIHGDNRAALGERFLKYQMFPDDHDPILQIQSAINSTIERKLPEFELRESASSFIEYKLAQLDNGVAIPTVPKWIQERVVGLAQVVSMIRAMVARKQGELLYRPSPEIGTRLSKQLIKLSQCIAFVLDKQAVDEECYSLLQRVGMDSCYGWHRDVTMMVAEHHPKGILKADIEKHARMGGSTTTRCLEDLYELGAIEYEEMETGIKGNPPKIWKLSPLMERLFQMSKILDIPVELPDIPDETRKRVLRRGKQTFKKFVAKR